MASVETTAETSDPLLVPNNVIKLEPTDKSKEASSCTDPSSAFADTPGTSSTSRFTNLSSVDGNANPDCSVANFDVGSLRFLENVKSPDDTKPLTDGSFINELVPKKHELKSSNSRRNSLNTEQPAASQSPSLPNYLCSIDNVCSLRDLPSGSTEADFGLVKEELHIEDIEEGAQYACLPTHSDVTENLFSNPLPDSINPFIKETEPESLLKTDVRMNENATQENVPQMLDLLNKPVKPVRRQRVKKTPKIGARLSSVISKLAQTKQTLILSQKDPSSSANSNSQNSFPTKPVTEASGGTTQLSNGKPAPADTASVPTTPQNSNNAQNMSNSTNQCLENSISNKCDEFSLPSNPISTAPNSIDATKSSLVVDRLKRLGTSIEVEKPTTDAFEPSIDGKSVVNTLNKSEPSITIEPQPFVTTRSLSQSLPTLRVPPPPKPKNVKKATKPSDSEVTSPKSRAVKISPSAGKPKPAAETVPSSSVSNPPLLEPNDDTNLLQYKNCLNALESLVKGDDLVNDLSKNCIKNKTNRKINKNVLKYDSKLSKQNWKSNLVMNESSPSKTTLILNKTIPSKTKIKIVNAPVVESNKTTNSSSKETDSLSTSQKIDGESVKAIMDKHTFTIGDKSVIEMPNGQKMYTCDVCSGVYQKGFSLKRHYLRSHINHYFIRIKESEANGEFTIQLSGGSDDNGGLDPAKALLFRCHVCGTCFSVKSELKCHLTAHPPVNSISNNDVKVYECINCSSVFNKKKEFSKHRKTCVIEVPVVAAPAPRPKQRLNEKLPCLFCAKVFPSPMERRKHGLKMHFPKRKGGHPCFKCVETFQTQTAVYQHLREVHRNDYFSCAACKERFHNDVELKAHCTKKHNGNADVMAILNDKNGVIESFEEKVEKVDKPEKSAMLLCSVCAKTFSNQSNLNKHMKAMHFPEKDDKVTLTSKHVVVLSKPGSVPGKEPKAQKSKIDLKNKAAAKGPSPPKSKVDVKSKDPDSAFYSELSDNIQFNLMHHIDGKLQNEKKNAALPSSETATTSSQSPVAPKSDSPNKTQSLAQLDLVGKSSANKGASAKLPDEKPNDWYGNTLNYTEDMSHLDIATQLTMKRNMYILNSSRAKSEDTSQVCGGIKLKRVKDLSKDLSLERQETLCAESFGDSTFGALESNKGLSGFWVRPHSYICTTCGHQSVNFWDMEDHKWNSHPNVKCSHFEFTEYHLPGYEFFTSRPFATEGVIEPGATPEVPSIATNRSRCSKCKKVCSSTLELHRHMLECGLDTTWMLTLMPSPSKKQKEKKKWRPFGSRRRRMSRVRGLKRNIPNSPMKIIFHPKLPLKSKSGDTESIQKMIANLPAKRATRRVVIFDNPNSKAGQATINSVPITSLNWNNNTYEDVLIENLLKNDQQAVPEGFSFSPSNESAATGTANKDQTDTNSSPTSPLSNLGPKTRIVPIWPPAEQSDVLTSLRMMPIPQVPIVTEAVRPIVVTKAPEPDVKPAPEALKPSRLIPPKTIKLRSLVRQLSASSLDSATESLKKSPVSADKSPDLSSGSSSPTASDTSIKVSSSITDKAQNKTPSTPTSPSKVLLALSKYSVKKPSDLAKEKSTILDAMRIAMANSSQSRNVFDLKSGKGKKLLTKSLSESLLTGTDLLKSENIADENQFSCIDCNKVFKNGAVLKRHLAKCPSLKLADSLSNMPDLVSPTVGEIESLISSPVVSSVKANASSKTKVTPPQPKLGSEVPQAESKPKPVNSRTKKTAGKDNGVELKIEDKTSKALKTKTLKKTPELSKSNESAKLINGKDDGIDVRTADKISKALKTKTLKKTPEFSKSNESAKVMNGKDDVILNDTAGEIIKLEPSFIPKSRRKVSIFTRSGKSKPKNIKMTNIANIPPPASETEVIVSTIEVKAEVHPQPIEKTTTVEVKAEVHPQPAKKSSSENVKTAAPPLKLAVPASTNSLINDMSSDSDTDVPLVQLKEILSSTQKGKKKQKVLMLKKKILNKKNTKLRKNLIRVKISKPPSSVEKTEDILNPNADFIEPILESGSLKINNSKAVSRKQARKSTGGKTKSRLVPSTKKKILRKKEATRGTRKSVRTMKSSEIVPNSPDLKPENEIKEDPNLDESFKLCLSEEDDKKDDLLAGNFASEKTDIEVKVDPKTEPVDTYSMPEAADISKQDVLSDAKSSSSTDDAPSKPKRKRRSDYNLLLTNLDMNELLTTIQADRQTLKRKCTVVESTDKKPKLGSVSDSESVEKSSDAEVRPQPESSTEVQSTDSSEASVIKEQPAKKGRAVRKPRLANITGKLDGEASDTESLLSSENAGVSVKNLRKTVGRSDGENSEKLSDAESFSQPENAVIKSSNSEVLPPPESSGEAQQTDLSEGSVKTVFKRRGNNLVLSKKGSRKPRGKLLGKIAEKLGAEKSSDTESLLNFENTGVSVKNRRKVVGKSDAESVERSSDAESFSQPENTAVKKLRKSKSDGESVEELSNETLQLPESSDTAKVKKAVTLVRGRAGKKVKTVALKTGTGNRSIGRKTNLGTTRKSAAESNKNLKQTILDDWCESEIGSPKGVSTDQVLETANTSNGNSPSKLSELSSYAESLLMEAQTSVNRKKKNQKLSTRVVGLKKAKTVRKPPIAVRGAIKAKNDNISEITNEPHKFEAPPTIVSPRTRAKRSNTTLVDDTASTESTGEFELDPCTGELRPIGTVTKLSNEDTVSGSASQSKSKNASTNAKTTVNNVESVANEVSDTPVNSKKRKRPKKSVFKDVNSEIYSDDDNLPLSSFSEENIASSQSINSEDAELSDTNKKSKKLCPERELNPSDSVDADDAVESDGNTESLSGNFLPLLRTKNKSKNLKRKRRKEFRQKNLLGNVDSPMTSDSEASILRVRKKQLKTKKSSLAKEISSTLDSNDLLSNNTVLRKQLAKVKSKKGLKKILDLINKGGAAVDDTETFDPSILEQSQSNDSLASSSILRKKKLKKKKSKKKLKNLKDKDLVNVLVQTVAKTANKLLTKKSAEQQRKKQLKLQRKKALEKLSHANNDWKISIVNPESTETLTTEIPDSSNDLEEKKNGSDKADSQTLESDEIDSNQSKGRRKFYCSLCDKNFFNILTYNKHFTMWKHMFNEKLLKGQETESLSAIQNSSSLESASVSSNTSLSSSISLSSLKNKLNAAAKVEEPAPAVPEPPAVSSVASPMLQELPVISGATAQPVMTDMEPMGESHWENQNWQANSAPEPVDTWFHDAWQKMNSYETTSLGSILDSVNQILADPASADPHGEPLSQYSLADLQHAICASDEEMALLQQLGENCQSVSESEYVYDNSAVLQGSQPSAFNEWTCESTDLIDLDNQNQSTKTPSPAAAKSPKKKSSQPRRPSQKRPSSPDEFDNVEMSCPVAACPKHFHGITALRTHMGWTHNKNRESKAYLDSESHLLATCLTDRPVDRNLVCFVCKEICVSQALLDTHVNNHHIRKKLDVSSGSSKIPSTEGAEKLKSKMSSAFGGLLDRALNNLKLNPQKTRPELGESSKSATASKINSETLKLLGQLKEKRRLENVESKTLTSNLAKELRQMLDHKKYGRPTPTIDSVTSRRSSIDSDAEVSSTTTKNEFMRPFGCPLCPMSFTTSLMRNRHISVHDDRKINIDQPIKVEPPREPSPPPELPVPKTTAPRKKPSKKSPLQFDFECDNCHSTVSCEEEPTTSRKPRRPTKQAAKPRSRAKKAVSPSTGNDSDTNRSLTSLLNDLDTESNSSQGSVPKTARAKKSIKETLAEQEMRQNEAFDLLLGKKPSPFDLLLDKKPSLKGKAKAPIRRKKPATDATPKSSVKRYEAAGMKALSKGRLNKNKKELKMPALKPVEAPTASRVSPDIPAPVLKPISAEVLKISERKTKPPPLLPGSLPKNDKAAKSIDTLSCDSDSCKLENPSFDLPEMEPYSSSMVESPKSSEEDKVTVYKRTATKKPVATPSKCDNISDLEQLFSDDDSDQEPKIEKKDKNDKKAEDKKAEDKISPESLKSITAFRDTMKTLKVQGSSEPKNSSSADVYNFED